MSREMKSIKTGRLSIQRETLRSLNTSSLANVVGGDTVRVADSIAAQRQPGTNNPHGAKSFARADDGGCPCPNA